MVRLCIVGCGITGAITAMLLKERFPQMKIVILEKSRGTGGRMCTSRSPFESAVDLGAQFITKTSCLSNIQKRCYSELIGKGLLQSLPGAVEGLKSASSAAEHFVCPQGSGSLVKHFLQVSDSDILFGHRVTKITTLNNKWKLVCDNNSTHECNAVVLTMPVPQILALDGVVPMLQSEDRKGLEAVEYCSRLALGLFYDTGLNYFDKISWVAKYVPNDPVIRFCSIDYKKRSSTAELPSVVVHTTKDFGKDHINDDIPVVQNLILSKIEHILPHMPEPSHIKFHKWRYSQVEKNYKGSGCLIVSKSPILICGGDGFSYSTFEGCILSAENIFRNVADCF